MLKNHLSLLVVLFALFQSQPFVFAQVATDGLRMATGIPTYSNPLQQMREEARALFMASDFEQSLRRWDAICRTSAATSYDYYWLGETRYHLSNFQDAAQALEYGLQKGPQLDLLYSKLAETYFALQLRDKVQSTCANGLAAVRDPLVRAQLEVYAKLAAQPLPEKTRSRETGRGRRNANG